MHQNNWKPLSINYAEFTDVFIQAKFRKTMLRAVYKTAGSAWEQIPPLVISYHPKTSSTLSASYYSLVNQSRRVQPAGFSILAQFPWISSTITRWYIVRLSINLAVVSFGRFRTHRCDPRKMYGVPTGTGIGSTGFSIGPETSPRCSIKELWKTLTSIALRFNPRISW